MPTIDLARLCVPLLLCLPGQLAFAQQTTCLNTPSQCAGDIDGNGSVGFEDVAIMREVFFAEAGDPDYNVCADFDQDGRINNRDLGTLKQNIFTQPNHCPVLDGFDVDASPFPVDLRTLSLGDIDDDGDTDLLSLTGDGVVTIHENQTSGPGSVSFANRAFPWFTSPEIRGANLGDADGDGDLDVTISSAWEGSLLSGDGNEVYLNRGAGSAFDYGFAFENIGTGNSLITMGDMNGDGTEDRLSQQLIQAPSPSTYLYTAGYSGDQTTMSSVQQMGTVPRATRLGDVDNDGDLDVLINGGLAMVVLSNDGSGEMETYDSVSLTDNPSGGIYGGNAANWLDMDDDGDLDVLVAGTRTRVFRNTPNGFVEEPKLDLLRADSGDVWARQIAVADLNGDCLHDVATLSHGGGVSLVTIHLNQGGSFASLPHMEFQVANYPDIFEVVDIDSDGSVDLLTSHEVLLNQSPPGACSRPMGPDNGRQARTF